MAGYLRVATTAAYENLQLITSCHMYGYNTMTWCVSLFVVIILCFRCRLFQQITFQHCYYQDNLSVLLDTWWLCKPYPLSTSFLQTLSDCDTKFVHICINRNNKPTPTVLCQSHPHLLSHLAFVTPHTWEGVTSFIHVLAQAGIRICVGVIALCRDPSTYHFDR